MQTNVRIALTVVLASCLVLFSLVVWKGSRESQWQTIMHAGQKDYAVENFTSAEANFSQASKLALDEFGQSDPRYADALRHQAWVLNSQGKYAQGAALLQKLCSLTDSQIPRIKLAQVQLSQLQNLRQNAQASDAPEGLTNEIRISSEILAKYFGPEDPELLPLRETLAFVDLLCTPPRFERAESQYLQMLAAVVSTEGPQSVGAARVHLLLGDLYSNWNNPGEATRHYNEAVSLYSQLLGSDSPKTKEAEEHRASPAGLPKHLPQT